MPCEYAGPIVMRLKQFDITAVKKMRSKEKAITLWLKNTLDFVKDKSRIENSRIPFLGVLHRHIASRFKLDSRCIGGNVIRRIRQNQIDARIWNLTQGGEAILVEKRAVIRHPIRIIQLL